MLAHRLVGRTLPIGAWSLTLLLCGAPRAAAPDAVRLVGERHPARRHAEPGQVPKATSGKDGCKAAYKAANEREQAGHLREARDSYQSCAKTACGAVVQPKCTAKAAQLGNDIPSV